MSCYWWVLIIPAAVSFWVFGGSFSEMMVKKRHNVFYKDKDNESLVVVFTVFWPITLPIYFLVRFITFLLSKISHAGEFLAEKIFR